jgi:hypothetical protein
MELRSLSPVLCGRCWSDEVRQTLSDRPNASWSASNRRVWHQGWVGANVGRCVRKYSIGGRQFWCAVCVWNRVRQVDWDEPGHEVHRAVNVGRQPYEEVVMFLLAYPSQTPQPTSVARTRRRRTRS